MGLYLSDVSERQEGGVIAHQNINSNHYMWEWRNRQYAVDFDVFRFLKRSAIFWIESASQEILKVEVG